MELTTPETSIPRYRRHKALGCIPKQPDSWRGNDAVRSNLNALLSEHVVCCGRDLKKTDFTPKCKTCLSFSCGTITLAGPPFQGSWISRPGHDLPPTLPPKATTRAPPLKIWEGKKRDFKRGLFPFRSPLLGESSLVSFPPLIEMLQFGG